MIKASGCTGKGDTLVMLGLSRTNCDRLLQDQPIKVDGQELGLPGIQVVLVGGETEQAIEQQLRASGFLSDDTSRQD